MRRRAPLLLALFAAAAVVGSAGGAAKQFRLTSPAFQPEKTIPVRYTCRGANLSPPLRWTSPSARARSFAIELHDPDAARPGGFTHWLAWGFPKTARGIATGKRAPIEGANSSGEPGYTGPCPPSGEHRYRFRIWALDEPLRLRAGSDTDAFERALRGHVVARAQLVGRFAASR